MAGNDRTAWGRIFCLAWNLWLFPLLEIVRPAWIHQGITVRTCRTKPGAMLLFHVYAGAVNTQATLSPAFSPASLLNRWFTIPSFKYTLPAQDFRSHPLLVNYLKQKLAGCWVRGAPGACFIQSVFPRPSCDGCVKHVEQQRVITTWRFRSLVLSIWCAPCVRVTRRICQASFLPLQLSRAASLHMFTFPLGRLTKSDFVFIIFRDISQARPLVMLICATCNTPRSWSVERHLHEHGVTLLGPCFCSALPRLVCRMSIFELRFDFCF